jgi:hypothetical protein
MDTRRLLEHQQSEPTAPTGTLSPHMHLFMGKTTLRRPPEDEPMLLIPQLLPVPMLGWEGKGIMVL